MTQRKLTTALTFIAIILIAACSLFADEFCNLELVDVWKSPYLCGASISNSGLAEKDGYLYFPGMNRIYILATSDSGHLELVSTELEFIDEWEDEDVGDIIVRNNTAYISNAPWVLVYDVSDPTSFDSLTAIEVSNCNQLFLLDSLLVTWTKSRLHLIDISDSTSLVDLKRINTPWSYTYLPTIDEDTYPYCLVPCERRVDEGPPEIWDAYINVIDLTESYDHSPYLNDWTPVYTDDIQGMKKVGDYYIGMCGHFLKFFEMDSVFGYTHVAKSYYMPEPFEIEPRYINEINDTLILVSSQNCFGIFNIADTSSIEQKATYVNSDDDCTEYYYDIIVQDTFMYVFTKLLVDGYYDTLAVYSFKIDMDFGIQCSFNDSPKNMEIKSYPNPFNGKCNIKYSMIDQYKPVNLDIYNINGKVVKNFEGLPSVHNLTWNATNYPSGIYLVKASNGIESISQKIIYLG